MNKKFIIIIFINLLIPQFAYANLEIKARIASKVRTYTCLEF